MENYNIYLEVRDEESVERTLRKFKRLCESYGIKKEYKKRKQYKKPSIVMKEKAEQSEKRRLKALRKLNSGRYKKF